MAVRDAVVGVRETARTGAVTRTRVLATGLVVALVATLAVIGEPSRPATATVARPIVTVQALCTVPTIVDVAAGEATRGLSAVHELLGRETPYVGELGREVTITDTDAGTFFVSIDDGELRVAALARTGLPVLAPSSDDAAPRTHRAFSLPRDLQQRDVVVVPADDAVFAVFGGDRDPVSVFRLDTATISSPTSDLSGSQDPSGPVMSSPGARPGSALAHDGVLWLASDDGGLWVYDPDVEPGQRWREVARGLDGPLLARSDDGVLGIFATDGDTEVRRFRGSESAPTAYPLGTPAIAVEAATYTSSVEPAFLVRGGGSRDGQAGIVRLSGGEPQLSWSPADELSAPALGLVANATNTAVLVVAGGQLSYQVLAADGSFAGAFPSSDAVRDDCVDTPGWPDAATTVRPLSVGSLLHLHDPSAPNDCVVDTRFSLDDLAERCGPGGDWSVDKGAAPEGDFSVEVGRALSEYDEDQERAAEEQQHEDEVLHEEAQQQLQEEFADVGLGIMEVDEDLADICETEEVTSVVPPTLEGAEPVGDSAIRAEWSWSGGQCLPERYLVESCVVASDGSDCRDRREFEVSGAGATSNRFATEVAARPDRTYRIAVTAIKRGGVSQPSNRLLVTMPASVPEPPTDVTASLQGGVWSVSWASCLDGGDCHQRPEGFVVTVEGCDGDGLPARRHSVAASERRVGYDLNGAGFPDADLLGRRVRFRVAAVAAGHSSDSVPAGSCQESVRAGRTVSVRDAGVNMSLSGRTQTMTLEGPERSPALTRLFGVASYDDVAARLVRQGSSTSSRTGALGSSVSFEVDRCSLDGWTVELTPRRGGSALSNHTARITGVPAACGWTVTDDVRPSARVTGGDASSYALTLTIPGLSEDVRNGKVESVTARSECKLALGGTRDDGLAGGSIDGDTVRFTGPTPAVFDLEGACRLSATVVGKDGANVTLRRADVDLRPAAKGVLARVNPVVIDALKGSMTGRYEGRWPRQSVVVTSEGSGVGCSITVGSSTWTFSISGGRSNAASCSNGRHEMQFRSDDLSSNGRADVTFEVRLRSVDRVLTPDRLDVCGLVSGERKPPCSEPPPPCPYNPDLPADDPACPPPCEWDSSIGADDPNCVEPPEEPEPCPWNPDLPADDPGCVDPDPGDGDPNPGDGEP